MNIWQLFMLLRWSLWLHFTPRRHQSYLPVTNKGLSLQTHLWRLRLTLKTDCLVLTVGLLFSKNGTATNNHTSYLVRGWKCPAREGKNCHSDLSSLFNDITWTWQGEIESQNPLWEQGPSVTFLLLKRVKQVQKCEPWGMLRVSGSLTLPAGSESDSWGQEKGDII